MPQIVPFGRYFGYTYPRLLVALETYVTRQESVASGSSLLISATVNGQSFTRATPSSTSTTETATGTDIYELQAALHFMRPDLYDAPPGTRAVLSFRGNY